MKVRFITSLVLRLSFLVDFIQTFLWYLISSLNANFEWLNFIARYWSTNYKYKNFVANLYDVREY